MSLAQSINPFRAVKIVSVRFADEPQFLHPPGCLKGVQFWTPSFWRIDILATKLAKEIDCQGGWLPSKVASKNGVAAKLVTSQVTGETYLTRHSLFADTSCTVLQNTK